MKKFYENPSMIVINIDAEIDTVSLSELGNGMEEDLGGQD